MLVVLPTFSSCWEHRLYRRHRSSRIVYSSLIFVRLTSIVVRLLTMIVAAACQLLQVVSIGDD